MPRKSTAQLAVQQTAALERRLDPPLELSDVESAVWRATVDCLPADWFNASHVPTLIAYCRHVATARVIDEQLAAFDPEWMASEDGLARYDKLLTMRDRQTRAILSCARSMRITQQSSYDKRVAGVAKRNTATARPWEGA